MKNNLYVLFDYDENYEINPIIIHLEIILANAKSAPIYLCEF